MLAPAQLQQKLTDVFTPNQAMVLTEVIYDSYRDLVKTDDFNELKEIVRQLAVSQQQLVVAQQRTEQRVDELAIAQQRTEQRVDELAVAQQRTEKVLQNLTKQVGGFSNRFGGDLEDAAYITIHDVLQREYGWSVGVLQRNWETWNGKEREIDIFGQAYAPEQPKTPIWIVGETKYNLTVKDVKNFKTTVALARENLEGEVFPVCFCYRARPNVQRAVKEAGINLVFSYGHLVPPD